MTLRQVAIIDAEVKQMTNDELIMLFNNEMIEYHEIRKKMGYEAQIIESSLNNSGGYATAKRFISDKPKTGFLNLHKKGLLQYSIEAIVVKPKYSILFTETERANCKRLLNQYGYNP